MQVIPKCIRIWAVCGVGSWLHPLWHIKNCTFSFIFFEVIQYADTSCFVTEFGRKVLTLITTPRSLTMLAWLRRLCVHIHRESWRLELSGNVQRPAFCPVAVQRVSRCDLDHQSKSTLGNLSAYHSIAYLQTVQLSFKTKRYRLTSVGGTPEPTPHTAHIRIHLGITCIQKK